MLCGAAVAEIIAHISVTLLVCFELCEASVVDTRGCVFVAFRSSGTGAVSEQSTVYWDLSKAEEDTAQNCHNHAQSAASAAAPPGGKFKISLQTIHQKQEMHSSTGGGAGGAVQISAAGTLTINGKVSAQGAGGNGGGGGFVFESHHSCDGVQRWPEVETE